MIGGALPQGIPTDDGIDLRRMIDQSCGAVTRLTPVRSKIEAPQTLTVFYDSDAERGPCYFRTVVSVKSSPYAFEGLFLQRVPYGAGDPVRSPVAVTRPADSGPLSPVLVDDSALSVANSFLASLLVDGSAHDALPLTAAAMHASEASLASWVKSAHTASGEFLEIRPRRFFRLTRTSTIVYAMHGEKLDSSLLVLVQTTGGAAAVLGFRGALGSTDLQLGQDLASDRAVNLVH